MPRPDGAGVRRPAPAGARRLLLLLPAGIVLLLAGAAPALGQAGYTGLPPAAPQDAYVVEAYVATYAGTPPGVAPPLGAAVRSPAPPLSGSGGTVSVAGASLDDAPPAAGQGDRRLVTGWDVVTITALGLTAVVAFATSAARFRSP